MNEPEDLYMMIAKPLCETLLLEIYKIKHNSKSCLRDLFSAVKDNYNQSESRVPGKRVLQII